MLTFRGVFRTPPYINDVFFWKIFNSSLLLTIFSWGFIIGLCQGTKHASDHFVKRVQIQSFFWSVFSRIRTEYGEILRISPYSVRMWENKDQKKLRIWTVFTQWTLCQLFSSYFLNLALWVVPEVQLLLFVLHLNASRFNQIIHESTKF